MAEHARTVLAAIVPARKDLLLYCMMHLQDEHFRSEVERNVYTLLVRYYDVAGDVLPQKTLVDLLQRQGIDEAKSLLYEQTFSSLVEMQVADHEFRYAVDALKDLRSKHLTGEAFVQGFEILERGLEINETQLKGHDDARQYMYSEFARIDQLNHAEVAPEGDIRLEGDEVLQEYAARKSGESVPAVLTGMPTIDAHTGGFQCGELILVAAYTGQGKSQFVTQCTWNAAVAQGKNVFFATSETVRPQARRRIIARHSREEKFEFPGGLNVKDIRDGTLDDRGEQVLRNVVEDLQSSSYGRIHIAQIPRGGTLNQLEARLRRQGDLWQIDFVVIDYLALIKSDRRRTNLREEYNETLQETKTLATSFYEGRGVPIISPWQMSKDAYKTAMQSGGYTLTSLADTSEAEKTPDGILALLRDMQNVREAKIQFLKLRDNDAPDPLRVHIDYRNAYLGEGEIPAVTSTVGQETDILALMQGA